MPSKVKRGRCPNGTRRNKKTGNCESTRKSVKLTNTKANTKAKVGRCPNGTRRNKKTGNCEKKRVSPKPKSPTPKPKSPTPKPKSPTPKPKSPTPKLKSPTPKPKSPTPATLTKPSDEVLITIVNSNKLTKDEVKKLVSSIPGVTIIKVININIQLKVKGSVKSRVLSLFPDNVKFVKKLPDMTTSNYEADLDKLTMLYSSALDEVFDNEVKYYKFGKLINKSYKAEAKSMVEHAWYPFYAFLDILKHKYKVHPSEFTMRVVDREKELRQKKLRDDNH